MKSFTKIFAMMLVLVMMVGMFSSVVIAAPSTDFSYGGDGDAGTINTKVNELGESVISIITTVARVIALAMVAIFAVKWMMATPQKKQELKERLIYLAIGVVLLFAGPSLLGIIAKFGETVAQ